MPPRGATTSGGWMDPRGPGGVVELAGRIARSSERMRRVRCPRPPGTSVPLGGDADADASTGAIGALGVPHMSYLSQAIGRAVLDGNGEPIGKVADLLVAVGDRYPPVTGLVVE